MKVGLSLGALRCSHVPEGDLCDFGGVCSACEHAGWGPGTQSSSVIERFCRAAAFEKTRGMGLTASGPGPKWVEMVTWMPASLPLCPCQPLLLAWAYVQTLAQQLCEVWEPCLSYMLTWTLSPGSQWRGKWGSCGARQPVLCQGFSASSFQCHSHAQGR